MVRILTLPASLWKLIYGRIYRRSSGLNWTVCARHSRVVRIGRFIQVELCGFRSTGATAQPWYYFTKDETAAVFHGHQAQRVMGDVILPALDAKPISIKHRETARPC